MMDVLNENECLSALPFRIILPRPTPLIPPAHNFPIEHKTLLIIPIRAARVYWAHGGNP